MSIEKKIKSTIVLDIDTKTVINLMHIGSWVNEKNVTFFKQFGLSSQQYNILRILRGQKGRPINLTDIHERMISKMSNTTRLIDKLILKGFVTRRTDKKNKRRVEIRITKKGLNLLEQIDLQITGHTESITKHLNYKESLILNELIDKLRGE
ncbi:MarR family winged helix-turn-helix transcriptional regulator [Flavicella marina]|uniref:MarR family winged helix-turn-helix transcriptional regulator n=1 Tax=Flavicella marina TaxID=1475951 RepID=UPI001263F361|nr:MarR family transcriptional regulator [Flavicella marina]